MFYRAFDMPVLWQGMGWGEETLRECIYFRYCSTNKGRSHPHNHQKPIAFQVSLTPLTLL